MDEGHGGVGSAWAAAAAGHWEQRRRYKAGIEFRETQRGGPGRQVRVVCGRGSGTVTATRTSGDGCGKGGEGTRSAPATMHGCNAPWDRWVKKIKNKKEGSGRSERASREAAAERPRRAKQWLLAATQHAQVSACSAPHVAHVLESQEGKNEEHCGVGHAGEAGSAQGGPCSSRRVQCTAGAPQASRSALAWRLPAANATSMPIQPHIEMPPKP